MNNIANLKTMNLESANGPVAAIVMGLNIRDPENADAFIQEVTEKFKAQRMCSPPDTSVMLVTLISEIPATRFVDRWRQLAADDKILGHFMSQMTKADVLRGVAVGQTLETVSLLHGPALEACMERGPRKLDLSMWTTLFVAIICFSFGALAFNAIGGRGLAQVAIFLGFAASLSFFLRMYFRRRG